MKISVVTTCFNSAGTIADALESFLAQDHADKELVVVDGASTDDTLAIVGRLASAHAVVISEPDRGVYDAMNKGLAAFSGDAVGFLNSDDRFKDRYALSRIASALADADICYGDLDFVVDHKSGRVTRRWRMSPYRKGAFAEGWMPAHPTFYVRRVVVDTVGRFNTDYRIAADYDYMLRAMELNEFRSRKIDETLVEMMQGGASTSGLGSYFRSNMESLRSRRIWLKSGVVDRALIAKPLRKVTQFLGR